MSIAKGKVRGKIGGSKSVSKSARNSHGDNPGKGEKGIQLGFPGTGVKRRNK